MTLFLLLYSCTLEATVPTHRLVFLDIADPNPYAQYRAEMEPLLARYGGHFALDVDGGDVRIHSAPFEPNRVLLLTFPDDVVASRFFADPAYGRVREAYFSPAVRNTHVQAFSGD